MHLCSHVSPYFLSASSLHDLDRGMKLVRAFEARFPPKSVSTSPSKPDMRSSRTLLYANRPIVRLTAPTEVVDDSVPPMLTFRDLEPLHARLVRQGWLRQKEIGYLKYVAKAYEGHLRKRRQMFLAK